MAVLVALVIGLVIWIVAWAFGVQAFWAFLVTVLLVLIAATQRLVAPYLRRLRGE